MVIVLTIVLWFGLTHLFLRAKLFEPAYNDGFCGTRSINLAMEQGYKIMLLSIVIAFPAALLIVLVVPHIIKKRKGPHRQISAGATYSVETDMIETQFDE